MYHGSLVALITPFNGDSVDLPALKKLVQFHLSNGTHGLVPTGTTGEASTLSKTEYQQVLETVVSETARQRPVIAGAGANDPAQAIQYSNNAAAIGVDAALHVMGYYNRPNQEGIYQHFNALNDATRLPIFAYNVPPQNHY